MSEVLKSTSHKNIRIDVEWAYERVHFAIKHDDMKQTQHSSLQEAKDAIDRFLQSQAKIATNAHAINKRMLDVDGNPLTVIGYNRNDGTLKVRDYTHRTSYGILQKSTSYSGRLYPDRPWVKELLIERAALCKRERALDEKLRRVEARHRSSYSGRIKVDEYEHYIADLERGIKNVEAGADLVERLDAQKAVKDNTTTDA